MHNDFGVDVKFFQGKQSVNHKHQEIELIYVLEGKVQIEVNGEIWELYKDDVIVINSRYSHSWRASEDAMVAVVIFDGELFTREIGSDYVTFWCNSTIESAVDYKPIRAVMGNLITEYAVNMEGMNFKKKSLLYDLMDCLLNHYLVESKMKLEMVEEDKLMWTALQYISNNYWRQLSLSKVASQVYMTSSTFSRYFKKHAGINFLEYLNNLRLQNALEDLLYSNKKLTDIALDHGFTNPAMFSKAFRAAYGIPPSDYKKQKREAILVQEVDENGLAEYRGTLEKYVTKKQSQTNEEVLKRWISVDTTECRPYHKRWNEVIGVGYAADLLSAKMQQHVLMLKDALGFSYVRIYSIFSWDMQMRKDRESDKLNFELLDSILDFIVTNKMHPVIDFGDKPKCVLENVEKPLFMYNRDPVFQSVEESRWVFTSFVNHITARYGSLEVEKWRFDIWKDNREGRGSSNYNYLESFDMIYEIIKKRVPGAQVGGCGSELGNELPMEIYEWNTRMYRPDFISICAFPYKRLLSGFSVKPKCAIRSTELHFMLNEVKKLKKQLKEAGLDDIPIEFSEWNLSNTDRNFYNDSCGKAAQLLMNMVELGEEISTGAYLMASDLSSSYYDSDKMFFGGKGLVSKDGLPKPVYYALHFMQKMGAYIIDSGDGYIVTTNGRSSYYIILFHYKGFNYNYFAKDEENIRPGDVEGIFTDRIPMEAELELNNIANGSYSIKNYQIGVNTSSILNQWMELGKDIDLNVEDIDYLKRICVPHIKISQKNVTKKYLCLKEWLEPHDIHYIHIHKNSDKTSD